MKLIRALMCFAASVIVVPPQINAQGWYFRQSHEVPPYTVEHYVPPPYYLPSPYDVDPPVLNPQNSDCTLLIAHPKWMVDKYQKYIDHVIDNIMPSRPSRSDVAGRKRLERSMMQNLTWTYRYRPEEEEAYEMSTKYFIDKAAAYKAGDDPDYSCVLSSKEEDKLPQLLAPEHMQLYDEKYRSEVNIVEHEQHPSPWADVRPRSRSQRDTHDTQDIHSDTRDTHGDTLFSLNIPRPHLPTLSFLGGLLHSTDSDETDKANKTNGETNKNDATGSGSDRSGSDRSGSDRSGPSRDGGSDGRSDGSSPRIDSRFGGDDDGQTDDRQSTSKSESGRHVDSRSMGRKLARSAEPAADEEPTTTTTTTTSTTPSTTSTTESTSSTTESTTSTSTSSTTESTTSTTSSTTSSTTPSTTSTTSTTAKPAPAHKLGPMCNMTAQCTNNDNSTWNNRIHMWPGGKVMVMIGADQRFKKLIVHVMETIMYMTCIKFDLDSRVGDDHYVYISDTEDRQSCNATLGMQKNDYNFFRRPYQNIHLHPDCMSYPVLMHLFLQTLGLPNEHVRYDRDRFIDFDTRNSFDPDWEEHQRKVYVEDMPVTPYGTDSIMHFGSTAWNTFEPPIPIIIAKSQPRTFKMSFMPSLYDFQRINYLYACNKTTTEESFYSLKSDLMGDPDN